MNRLSLAILIALSAFSLGCVRPAVDLIATPETIPDGRVGVEYAARIDIEKVSTVIFAVKVVEGELPAGLELKLESEPRLPNYISITGTPEIPGEHAFSVRVSCSPLGMLHEAQKNTFEYSIDIQPAAIAEGN